MIQFNSVIKKFAKQGEKTGWSYIEIPEEVAIKIKPDYIVEIKEPDIFLSGS